MNATYQEQEHIDHVAGSASEFQNCYSEADAVLRQRRSDFSVPVARARSLGLFVVVEEMPYYCRATDAIVGTYERFVVAFPTQRAADERAAALYARCGADAEVSFRVLLPA